MGWLALALIGLGSAITLGLVGLPRRLWSFAAAAMMLGATGYALQGRPMLGGAHAAPSEPSAPLEPGLVAFRDAILAPSPDDARVLRAADDRLRGGDARGAVSLILDEVARRPRDATLWAALGSALSAHDGRPSPAALFAFRRAFVLAPRDPGPPFLLGLAYLEEGELPPTEQAWAQALALAPPDAPWAADLREQLALVRQFSATTARDR